MFLCDDLRLVTFPFLLSGHFSLLPALFFITMLSKLKKEDMAKELASAINETDCMPFPDELNLSTSIQPSESLSQPIPKKCW
jgi:hypothetical protein